MSMRFFKDVITVYHMDGERVMRLPFDQVYFRHNKKSNLIDKRA